jgi:hypothetical protein
MMNINCGSYAFFVVLFYQCLLNFSYLRHRRVPESNSTAKLGGGDDVEVSNSSYMTATIYFPLTTSIYLFHYFCNGCDCEASKWDDS